MDSGATPSEVDAIVRREIEASRRAMRHDLILGAVLFYIACVALVGVCYLVDALA